MTTRSSSVSNVEQAHLEDAVGHLSKKWSISIVRVLLADGAQGFSALQESLDGISSKVLSDSLESLQDSAIVERRVLQEKPLRVEYRLTDRGRALEPVIDELEEWAANHEVSNVGTVLVADDDPRLVEMHAEWLADSYEVQTATDGKEARELLGPDVDVLVADRRMTGLSGEQLAQYVALSDDDCAIVFVSSLAVDESLLDVPFDEYIQKPTTPSAIKDTVEQWLTDGEETRRAYESVTNRIAQFESALGGEVRRDERYQRLRERAAALESELDDGQPTDRSDESTHGRPV